MSWISTNNLRRFADNLFHGKLSFSGNVTHNGAVEFNGGVKVNTVKAEFTAPVSFTGTATYKNNEIATKADIVAGGDIVVDDELSSTSTNAIQNRVVQQEFTSVRSSIPTKVSQLTNDSGYITKADITEESTPDLTPYMKKTADSDLMMGVHKLIFGNTAISDDFKDTVPMFTIDATGGRGVNIKGPSVLVNGIPIATETDLSDKLDKTGTAAAAIKATQDGEGNVIATTYIKTINNLKPDDSGNINISTGSGSGSGVSTSTQNTWTAKQNFQYLKFNFESFATSRISGTYDSPSKSVAAYNVTGALTLDMSTLAGMIGNGDTSIFTAYIASNGSYALSITNAGTLKYAGSAADLAITASGLLLNIFLTKNTSGVVTSIAQATKLS